MVNRPMPRGVVLQGAFDRFPIEGNTEREIGQSLQAAGVREGGFIGHYSARWRASWRYVEGGVKAGCRLEAVRIDLESRIRIPEWRRPSNAAPELVTKWQTFSTALDNHEREHERIAITMAGDLVRQLERMQDLSCRQLGQDANGAFRELARQMQERENKFDVETRHGIATGVRWPPPPPNPPPDASPGEGRGQR